jgi:hypothetical protein
MELVIISHSLIVGFMYRILQGPKICFTEILSCDYQKMSDVH